ncbi:MAG: hypothetical protein NVSMB64_26110 [Candidatus Velthaea sp.]
MTARESVAALLASLGLREPAAVTVELLEIPPAVPLAGERVVSCPCCGRAVES